MKFDQIDIVRWESTMRAEHIFQRQMLHNIFLKMISPAFLSTEVKFEKYANWICMSRIGIGRYYGNGTTNTTKPMFSKIKKRTDDIKKKMLHLMMMASEYT